MIWNAKAIMRFACFVLTLPFWFLAIPVVVVWAVVLLTVPFLIAVVGYAVFGEWKFLED